MVLANPESNSELLRLFLGFVVVFINASFLLTWESKDAAYGDNIYF